jgi:teichuronic acid exporter
MVNSEYMKNSFLGDIANGVKWTAIDKLSSQVIKFLLVVILSRFLTPEHFGLIAIAMFFVLLAENFISSGFTHAYVNLGDDKDGSLLALFFLNSCASILLTSLVLLSSSYISDFYQSEDLKYVLDLLALIIILDGAAAVYKSKLEKDLKFNIIALINLPSLIISTCICVVFAWCNYGVWSLVIQVLSYKTVTLAMSCWLVKPNFNTSNFMLRVKQFLKYGWTLQLAAVANNTSKEMNTLMIASSSGLSDTGHYSRANNLQNIIVQTSVMIIEKVTFPVMSKFKSERDKVISSIRLTNKIFAFAIYPVLMLVYFNSELLVKLVFGSGWGSTADILSILVFAGIFRFMQSSNLTLLKVFGYTGEILKLRLIESAITVVILGLGLKYGLKGLLVSQIISVAISYVMIALFSSKLTGYTIIEQIKDVLPYAFSALVMLTFLYFFNINEINGFNRIPYSVAIGCIIYLLSTMVLGAKEVFYFISFYKKK